MKYRFTFILIVLVYLLFLVATRVVATGEPYQFPWPGILPDSPLYKLKVLRNKIIPRLIISPVKRIEFDLLMADKTLYAGKLLLEKGKVALAAETALKGENYFSILVSEYRTARVKKITVPTRLTQKVIAASDAESKLIDYLIHNSTGAEQETFQKVLYFSEQNRKAFLAAEEPEKR